MKTLAIIFDGNYVLKKIYDECFKEFKNKENIYTNAGNNFYQGYQFINNYFDQIKIKLREFVGLIKTETNYQANNFNLKIYITKSSSVSWRLNVNSEYINQSLHEEEDMRELINLTFKKVIEEYCEEFKICEQFNLESDDCISLIQRELKEEEKDDLITFIFSENIRANQLQDEKTTVYNYKKELLYTKNDILSENNQMLFNRQKFLFFLILKGYMNAGIEGVFDDLNDIEIEQLYNDNELLQKECEDILIAEHLRINYLLFDYSSIPKKLAINFRKNNFPKQ